MSRTKNNFKQLKLLKIEEIQNKILELKKNIILIKIKQKTKQKAKPHVLKTTKHEISQLMTLEHLYTTKIIKK
uniref:Ribosomal protein L29 n=1 Tax=Cumathamnion serrulatum TaxID=1206573 RepID=A0A7U1G3X8_9FLOR|nr:ribosomal protein L29 [Cumathamnion serrulatum]QQY85400.1 ribosomal protein L29 [Cumathamnion serrulatum]